MQDKTLPEKNTHEDSNSKNEVIQSEKKTKKQPIKGKSMGYAINSVCVILSTCAIGFSGFIFYKSDILDKQVSDKEFSRLYSVEQDLENMQITNKSLMSNIQKTGIEIDSIKNSMTENSRVFRAEIKSQFDHIEKMVQEAKSISVANSQSLSSLVLENNVTPLPVNEEIIIQEISYLLFLANQNLKLTNNVNLAKRALNLAYDQMKKIANPRFIDIKKVIAKEIALLDGLDSLDITDMSISLDTLSRQIESLSLKNEFSRKNYKDINISESKRQDLPESTFDEFANELFKDLNKLVRVRRVDQTQSPRAAEMYKLLITENLRINIEAVKIALVSRDLALFTTNIDEVRYKLKKYFKADSALLSFDDNLAKLLEKSTVISPPDISKSLQMIRSEIQQIIAK